MAARQWMSRGLVTIGFAMLASCADDGVSLHVICPIVPDIEDDSCVWDAASEACTVDGVLNVAAATYYRLNLKVESGLKARQRDVPPLGEPNGLQMTHAKVELRTVGGGVLSFKSVKDGKTVGPDNPFEITASGYIEPSGSNIIPLTVMTSEHVAQLRATGAGLSQVVVAVKLHGKTNGDQEVETSEYSWPVRLINKDPREASGQCIAGIPICLGSVGQDGFAEACTDSKLSN